MNRKTNNTYGIDKERLKIVNKKLGFNNRFHVAKIIKSKASVLTLLLQHKKQARTLIDFNHGNVNFLKNNRSYRGLRHRRNLPVRGQRTHTNAKTAKKKSQQVAKKR